jgi:hypothetical protein
MIGEGRQAWRRVFCRSVPPANLTDTGTSISIVA